MGSFSLSSYPPHSPHCGARKNETEDDYSVSAYGDVSLTDAYVIPGTPSTKKPRLKLKHKKPRLPSKHVQDNNEETLAGNDTTSVCRHTTNNLNIPNFYSIILQYSRSTFLSYLSATSSKASGISPDEDFMAFFDTLKAGRASTRKMKGILSDPPNPNKPSSPSPLTKTSSRQGGKSHRSSGVKRRLPIPLWDQPTPNK